MTGHKRFWHLAVVGLLSLDLALSPVLSFAQPAVIEPPSGFAEVEEALDVVFGGVREARTALRPERFEVPALAESLGWDPERLYAHVRDVIHYEPYRGLLRGAEGTLAGSAGNALDQANLLARLLRESGLDVRFAQARLDAETAALLVESLFDADPPAMAPDIMPVLSAMLEELPGSAEEGLAALDEFAAALDAEGARLEADLDATLAWLDDLVPIPPDAAPPYSGDQLIAEAADHYWVQYRDLDGTWIDLDPSARFLEPGEVLAEPEATFAEIGPELQHSLEVTVTIRRHDPADGSDTDEVLLRQTVFPSDVFAQQIALINVPDNADWGPPGSLDVEAIDEIEAFQAVLTVGDEVTTGRVFDLAGQVFDAFSRMPAIGEAFERPTGALEGLADLIGGGDGEPEPEAGPGTLLTGYWIDIAPSGPDSSGPPVTARRYVLDPRRVTGWRDGAPVVEPVTSGPDPTSVRWRLLAGLELLPLTGAASPDYAAIAELDRLLALEPSLRAHLASLWSADPAAIDRPRPPPQLLGFATDRFAFAETVAARSGHPLRAYQGDLGLVLLTQELLPGMESGVGARRTIDIVENATRVATAADTGGADARRLARALGVFDTKWESVVLTAPGQTHAGADRRLAAARAASEPMVLMPAGSAGLDRLADLAVEPEVAADLALDLAAGYEVLVAGTAAGTEGVAWWRLDPADGTALGMVPGPGGQDSGEYFVVLEDADYDSIMATIAYREWIYDIIATVSVSLACVVVNQAWSSPTAWMIADIALCAAAGLAAFPGVTSFRRAAIVTFVVALATWATP